MLTSAKSRANHGAGIRARCMQTGAFCALLTVVGLFYFSYQDISLEPVADLTREVTPEDVTYTEHKTAVSPKKSRSRRNKNMSQNAPTGTLMQNDGMSALTKHNGTATSTAAADSAHAQWASAASASKDGVTKNDKVILLWTPFWQDPLWGMQSRREPFDGGRCHYDNCYLTNNREYLNDATFVLFNCRNKLNGYPTERKYHQIWTMYCAEAVRPDELIKFDYHINMSATYRSDSDLRIPYYWAIPRGASLVSKYVPKMTFQAKTKSIAWVVSHCRTNSHREDYVKELSKYIDVDIYGKCGPLSCPRGWSGQCWHNITKNYKFYLSFENNLCRDYVSEKFFRALGMDIVPIGLSDTNYSSIVPAMSFIDVRDFRSPRLLADYLKSLSANQTAYEEYFQWKLNYKIAIYSRPRMWCDLCRIANEGTYHKPAYSLSKWWSTIPCDNNFIPGYLSDL